MTDVYVRADDVDGIANVLDRRTGWTALRYAVLLVLLAVCIGLAGADDKADFERRAASNFMTLFQSLDRDGDGRVTQSEARGDLTFSPRFNDMDINRDGVVTLEELQRYVRLQYGVEVNVVSR